MKRKHILISILVLFASLTSEARLPDSWFFRRFNIGVEWGYTQCLMRAWDYNILSEEGYRIYDKDAELMIHPNASLMGQIGFLLNDYLVVGLYGGYVGMGRDNRLLPLQLRLSWFLDPLDEDGGFCYFQGGPAFHLHLQKTRVAWLFASGLGYRFRLNYDCYLDISLGVKYLNDHPPLPNPEGPGYVPAHSIRKNNAGYYALDLSVGFNF